MKILILLGTLVGQFLLGYVLGFVVVFALGIGNGWELVAMPIGDTLGVWGVGVLVAWLRGTSSRRMVWLRLATTAAGSALGVLAILLTPPTGFIQVLYPLIAALIGYYAPTFFTARDA